ncbi:unnamed protein product [Knipowitschia caucasica]|uniref:Uncharacterized protein n=1 Tax=Knipowitschia caucasica TaxID=637954 RepID=A0AAV2LCT4_KNICA
MAAAGRRAANKQPRESDSNVNKEEAAAFLTWDVMTLQELEDALRKKSEEDLHIHLSEKLHLSHSEVCMKEAALLQYYVQGLSWAQEAQLTPLQTSFTLAVLDLLLHNVTEKGLDFVNNVVEFAKALAAACQDPPTEEGPPALLSPEEARGLVTFTRESLFQKYQMYQALLSPGQEDTLLGAQETVDVLWSQEAVTVLEEGVDTHLLTPDI